MSSRTLSTFFAGCLADLRFAARNLARQPQFTVPAVGALALGLGAAVAIFSVVHAVALQPLPYPEADRVLRFRTLSADRPHGRGGMSLGFARVWSERSPSFSAVAAYQTSDVTLTGFDRPERLHGSRVTGDFFRVLGVAAALGRTFDEVEVGGGADRLVVLSEDLWRRRFEASEEALGATVTLDGEQYAVIGVMPADFRFPDPTVEFWAPMQWTLGVQAEEGQELELSLPVIGRLADGVALHEAVAEGQNLLAELEHQAGLATRPLRRGPPPPDEGRRRREAPEQAGEAPSAQTAPGPGQGESPGPAGQGDAAEDGEAGSSRRAGPAAHGGDEGRAGEERPPSRFALETLLDEQVEPVRPAIRMLAGAVALLLLVACANVANLQLARGVGRRREPGTRHALGAGRRGLARLLLSESLVLSAAGGVAGLLLAFFSLRLVRAIDPGDIPRLGEAALHPEVLVFALAGVLVCALVFGTLPLVQVLRARLEMGREETVAPVAGGTAGAWVRSGLVVAEIAMALVLLIAAGLLARSFVALSQIDPGYDRETLAMYVPVPLSDYPAGPARTALYQDLLERVRTLPTVDEAGYVNFLPLFSMRIVLSVQVEGSEQPSDPRDVPSADLRIVSDGYFETMGIALRDGRGFTAADRAGAEPVVIVNETFARTLVPGRSAVGESLAGFGEIVGVVGDVRLRELSEPASAAFYVPVGQMPPMLAGLLDRLALVVRTDQRQVTVDAVRATLAELDPNLALDDVATMQERLAEAVAQPRFFAGVLAVFSGLALGLALLGVYSVLSFARSQERRQTGIRIAMGATPAQVLRRSLASGARLTGVGIVLGVVLAVLTSRLLETFLYQVGRLDAWTYAALAAVLAAAALAASYLPARRASRTDPVEALRVE